MRKEKLEHMEKTQGIRYAKCGSSKLGLEEKSDSTPRRFGRLQVGTPFAEPKQGECSRPRKRLRPTTPQ